MRSRFRVTSQISVHLIQMGMEYEGLLKALFYNGYVIIQYAMFSDKKISSPYVH